MFELGTRLPTVDLKANDPPIDVLKKQKAKKSQRTNQ